MSTLYGAIDDGALAIRLGKQARKELEGQPRLRAALPWLREAFVPGLSGDAPGGVLVQGTGLLPFGAGHRAAHVPDGSESHRARAA